MAESKDDSKISRKTRSALLFSAIVVVLAMVSAIIVGRLASGKEIEHIDNSRFFTDIPRMNLEVLDVEGHASRISGNRVDLVPFKGVYSIDLDKAKVVRTEIDGNACISVLLPEIGLDTHIDEKNARNLSESEKKGIWETVKGWFRFASKTGKGLSQAKHDDEKFRNDIETRLRDEMYMEAARQQGITMTRQLIGSLNDSETRIEVCFASEDASKEQRR